MSERPRSYLENEYREAISKDSHLAGDSSGNDATYWEEPPEVINAVSEPDNDMLTDEIEGDN